MLSVLVRIQVESLKAPSTIFVIDCEDDADMKDVVATALRRYAEQWAAGVILAIPVPASAFGFAKK